MKNIHPTRRQAHHLILDLEWNPFSVAMIAAKVFLFNVEIAAKDKFISNWF